MSLIDVRRLAIGSFVLAALMLPLYLLVLKPEKALEPGFSNAALIDTPAAAGQQKVGLKVGELAPNFAISTTDGGRITLAELRGKPVLISFFALWCGSCLSEMPIIDSVHEQRGRESFTVLAINAGESRDRAMEFIDFIQAPFTWTLDFDLTVADAYGVRGLPQTFYLDEDGVVRAEYAGTANEARLSAYLEAAFTATEPPGFPFTIRPVSTIPRERLLSVQAAESGRIIFTSRSLRCDATYCRDEAIAGLKSLPGIASVQPIAVRDSVPAIEVRFDSAVVSQSSIVDFLVKTLERLPDPLYQGPFEVKFVNS